jgi:ferrochelatase
MNDKCGVLLTNIGSPETPTPEAVRTYLKKFLSDPRVVQIPRIIWWPILYGIILRTRPQKSAELYRKIWTEKGSPLTYFSEQLSEKLQSEMQIPVEIGMHYSHPSIETALKKLCASDVRNIIVLPLYPQYSNTTTASTFDQVKAFFANKTQLNWASIDNYHNHPMYIDALCSQIKSHPIQHLLFSFHGIPEQFITQGDPYAKQCHETVRLITENLALSKADWSISFQSRLGRAKWLTPYTDQVLQELPKRGIKNLHVICPGFAVDCLETLEEIAIRGKEQFVNAGGETFHYIPALNDELIHVQVLQDILITAIRKRFPK